MDAKKNPSTQKFLLIQYEVIGAPIPDETYPEYNSGYESKGIVTTICSEDEFNQCPPDPETTRNVKVLATLDANNPIVKRFNMHSKLVELLTVISNTCALNGYELKQEVLDALYEARPVKATPFGK